MSFPAPIFKLKMKNFVLIILLLATGLIGAEASLGDTIVSSIGTAIKNFFISVAQAIYDFILRLW